MNTNSVFDIKKPINPPLLNIAQKVILPKIFVLPKLLENPNLYPNKKNHSISVKIIIMLSTAISSTLPY